MTEELLFASTTPGLEPALEQEMRALGWSGVHELGGVSFRGSYQEANLRLRTAGRVLVRLGEFRARGPRDLLNALRQVPIGRVWDGASPLSIRGVGALARECERAASQVWKAKSASSSSPRTEISIRLHAGTCTVSADSSGELLYLRGYRQEVGRAPLRETLAAGMLVLAHFDGGEALWDPMCGSGTIAIEGGLIAMRKAPGANRRFAFEQWPSHDGKEWNQRLRAARGEELAQAPWPMMATDLNAGALGTARRNARRAGVPLTLERLDATSAKSPAESGLIVSNLPYGKRVGKGDELSTLFRAFGAALRGPLARWRYALLVADDSPHELLGLAPEKTFALENGGIRCRLMVGSPE